MGLDDGDGREGSLLPVESQQRGEVDVGDAVGVGGAEGFPAEPSRKRLDPPAGRRVEAAVDRLDPHPLRPALSGGELRQRLAHVAGRQQEAIETLGRVDLDHMPEDRPAADLDQRLRHRLGSLAQPRPAAATENYDGWLHWVRHCGGYSPPNFGMASATRDRGEDGYLVAVPYGRLQPLLEADVLAGDVDVDEAAQVAVLGDPVAEAAVGVEDGVEHLADGPSVDLQLRRTSGRCPQLGRDLHGD